MAIPETITVTSLRDHTTDGVPHTKGEVYDAPYWAVNFLVHAGYAFPGEATPPAVLAELGI